VQAVTAPLLELTGVDKRYPGVHALADVDLSLEAGEVHALLGQNGAGKSTLMKIIAGAEAPDRGTISLRGRPVPQGAPAAARAAGIGIVFQELSLVPTMSVGENVLLGRWDGRGRWPDVRRTERAAEPHLRRIGLDVPAGTRVDRLNVAERQLVEIAKALSTDVSVLLLDEPTSALSDRESRRLFDVIRGLKAEGVAVGYVSHRLPEVLGIADRITVLRDGRRVGSFAAADVAEAELAQLMVGERVTLGASARTADGSSASNGREPLFRAVGFGRPPRLKPVDLDVAAGEVVTVFGLVGAGRSRLARALFGLDPAAMGWLEVDGRQVRLRSPADAIAAGIGYVGEDRSAGLVPRMSVGENITLASMPRLTRRGMVDRAAARRIGTRYVERLGIRTPSVDHPVGTLSGGNQQKVLLARWLCSQARLLILDDPVRGVDVAAKEDVFRLVRELTADGAGILYFTSELREARMLGDRLLVMADGRVARELSPTANEDEIMAAAGGVDV
jgi:ABC-type sugar transport system ATPase subunit